MALHALGNLQWYHIAVQTKKHKILNQMKMKISWPQSFSLMQDLKKNYGLN